MGGRGPDAERLHAFLKRDLLKPQAGQATKALTVFEPFFAMANGDMPIPLIKKDDQLYELICRNAHLVDDRLKPSWDIQMLDPEKPSPEDFRPYVPRRYDLGEARTSLFLEGSITISECLVYRLKRQFQAKMQKHYSRMHWQFMDELESRLAAPFYELMDAVIRGDADLTPHIGRIQIILAGLYPVPARAKNLLYLPVAQM